MVRVYGMDGKWTGCPQTTGVLTIHTARSTPCLKLYLPVLCPPRIMHPHLILHQPHTSPYTHTHTIRSPYYYTYPPSILSLRLADRGEQLQGNREGGGKGNH